MAEDLDDRVDRACADGRLSVEDAEEIRRFADFLTEAGRPGSRTGFEAWRKHYPEDYERALAEQRARGSAAAQAEPCSEGPS